jgi:hypothetical protein
VQDDLPEHREQQPPHHEAPFEEAKEGDQIEEEELTDQHVAEEETDLVELETRIDKVADPDSRTKNSPRVVEMISSKPKEPEHSKKRTGEAVATEISRTTREEGEDLKIVETDNDGTDDHRDWLNQTEVKDQETLRTLQKCRKL